MREWENYLEGLASKAPVPGGGGASAVGGALGTALGEMVGNLTAGKKKYMQWEDETQACLKRLSCSREHFLELSEEDARVFEPLSRAYGMKAETEEEKAAKAEYMEKCLTEAAGVPLRVMEECFSVMDSLEFLAEHGSRLAVSDAGVGIQFIRSALLGAVMNVYINTKLMKDREKAKLLNERADSLAALGTVRADRIYEIVRKAVRG